MAEARQEPTITEKYTAQLQELNADIQHHIAQAFQEHRETWNNVLTYEQARWRWATEEQRTGPDTSFVGQGLHAEPKPPEVALETSQAVQVAIQATAAAREAREAWLLDPEGTTRQQLIHREAYEVQHPDLARIEIDTSNPDLGADWQRQLTQLDARLESVSMSPGERLIAYYTELKAHLREQEQRELPLEASERRQEVLAFAAQWQEQHGPVHDAAHDVQRDYAAMQERRAEQREAREQTPALVPSRETGMEY